ncbi:HXXEE domain-containing protein [Actinomadura sp. ATCC 31491]|uniref:HXXEE domain-containing protein n=1 Tax=Actinomadura luzonensis TaxID=2805427 RepID=A0ABT0G7M9_9ACTN|nr:HXXEE domain-containing protein [Actinomadura luzonensis]MCK2220594.1 HXXEE domain-containing protein [Actinomadura luzonensis]
MAQKERTAAVPAAVTWGLLGAWAVHDAEELVTMARWLRAARPRLEQRFPAVPWARLELSQAHVTVAIGLMGGVMAGAAALGARTGGRSPVFQAVLAGFGAHGAGHLAQAAVVRGYTPGALTSPVVVIPFTVWAWRRLKAAGVPTGGGGRSAAAGLAALPLVLGAVHGLAHVLTRRASASRAGRTREGGRAVSRGRRS